jgi:transposase
MMRRQKTDPIDAAAIGDLLRRGEGSPYRPLSGVYLHLQQLDRVRLSKIKIRTMLKNQIIGHLDRIFPGLLIVGHKARQRYQPLFTTDFWQCHSLQHLIRVCPDPRRLAQMSEAELIAAFHQQGYPLGTKTAAKLIAYAQQVLWPDPELVTIRAELLQHDLQLLEAVEARLVELESRLVSLLEQTPYQFWTRLKGLSPSQVISLAAAIGDPAYYEHAKQVFRRSGLVSGRNDSGLRQRQGQGQRVLKTGDVYLRRALMNALETLILHQPVLSSYYGRLKGSKPDQVARVATARRALGILWATLRDQRADHLLLKGGLTM